MLTAPLSPLFSLFDSERTIEFEVHLLSIILPSFYNSVCILNLLHICKWSQADTFYNWKLTVNITTALRVNNRQSIVYLVSNYPSVVIIIGMQYYVLQQVHYLWTEICSIDN